MEAENIIERLNNYLDQHVSGTRGWIGQRPYKDDFFKLFEIAYKKNYIESGSPRLTGDGITDAVTARYIDGLEKNKEKLELLQQLTTWWREWTYAWQSAGL